MNYKFIPVFLLFAAILGFSALNGQNYVDILNASYIPETAEYGFLDSDTKVKGFSETNIQLVVPIPVSDRVAFVGGVDYITNPGVTIDPNGDAFDLYFIRAKMGINYDITDNLNLLTVILPRAASNFYEYRDIDNYGIGGLGMLKYKFSDNFYVKGGIFGSSEVFGMVFTPVFGFYYKGPGEKVQLDVAFPQLIEGSYGVTNSIKVGFDLVNFLTSYKLDGRGTETDQDYHNTYISRSELEASVFAQLGLFDNLLLLRAKLFYRNFDYALYDSFDNLPLQIFAFELNDERERLNPEFDAGGIGFKVQAVVRFDLSRLDN